MIHFQIDLGSLEDYPTNRLPDFAPCLLELLPGLAQHGCSYRTDDCFDLASRRPNARRDSRTTEGQA
ncbi:MAG: hypothetical protein H7X93_04320 [Sphingomonadaceae bacterium]|nr:hypothetical protein [Sphingomonadaceae bacterium]